MKYITLFFIFIFYGCSVNYNEEEVAPNLDDKCVRDALKFFDLTKNDFGAS